MPEKAAELQKMLHRWQKQVNAKMPVGERRNDFETFKKARDRNK